MGFLSLLAQRALNGRLARQAISSVVEHVPDNCVVVPGLRIDGVIQVRSNVDPTFYSLVGSGRSGRDHHSSSLLENPYIPYQYMDSYLSSTGLAGYRHGRKIGTSPTARAWLIASLNRMESLEAGNQTESETRDTLMASDRLARIEMIVSRKRPSKRHLVIYLLVSENPCSTFLYRNKSRSS
ncbi:hypothetical protein TIFTF001_039202 [Ficus carica]|uniref:Uncharacterized protein ycf68 n=1 Tax=Ficus carica TaxID=3494 RepID=A0AA88JDW7_FICCA|nr:hypothetical protein TIFTF001_039202 [Ficus carica]